MLIKLKGKWVGAIQYTDKLFVHYTETEFSVSKSK